MYVQNHWLLPVTPVCNSKLGHHWLRWWPVACSVPNPYLNRCWPIINWSLGKNFRQIQSKYITVLFTRWDLLTHICVCGLGRERSIRPHSPAVIHWQPGHPREQSSWGQHGAHLGPVGPRWAPCWPHEPCYRGMRSHPMCIYLPIHHSRASESGLWKRVRMALYDWNMNDNVCIFRCYKPHCVPVHVMFVFYVKATGSNIRKSKQYVIICEYSTLFLANDELNVRSLLKETVF